MSCGTIRPQFVTSGTAKAKFHHSEDGMLSDKKMWQIEQTQSERRTLLLLGKYNLYDNLPNLLS